MIEDTCHRVHWVSVCASKVAGSGLSDKDMKANLPQAIPMRSQASFYHASGPAAIPRLAAPSES